MGIAMGKSWVRYFGAVCLFDLVINGLLLSVPIYMIVVYDRVAYSFSTSSLVALSAGLAAAAGITAVLTYLKSRIRIKAGIYLEKELTPHVLVRLHSDAAKGVDKRYEQGLEDVACLRESIWGRHFSQLVDLPWILLYFVVLFFFHPWMVFFAAGAYFIAEFFYFLARLFCRNRVVSGDAVYSAGRAFLNETLDHAEMISGMGMLPDVVDRFEEKQRLSVSKAVSAENFRAAVDAVIFFISLVAMAGVFGLGAYLFFDGRVSTGMMAAAVLVVLRLFYPFGSKLDGIRQGLRAAAAYKRIKAYVETRGKKEQLDLPRPEGRLSVEGVMLVRGNRHLLQQINFMVEPGEALGIIGPTGAGKTLLLKLILGIWAPSAGKVRLDGADTAFWDSDAMGPHVGYVPQTPVLFSGKVSDNISRFSKTEPEPVILAAQKAGAHEMILNLVNGYDTLVGKAGQHLSQGQCRRIAIAGALYRDPALVVMDRPNADLDETGLIRLLEIMKTLKQEKTTLVMVTENPKLLMNTDKLLFLKDGQTSMFGPTKEVLTNLRSKQGGQQG